VGHLSQLGRYAGEKNLLTPWEEKKQSCFSIQATVKSTYRNALIKNQKVHQVHGIVYHLPSQVHDRRCDNALMWTVSGRNTVLESGEGVGTITTLVMTSVRGGKRIPFVIQLSEGRLTNWKIRLTNAVPNCKDTTPPPVYTAGEQYQLFP